MQITLPKASSAIQALLVAATLPLTMQSAFAADFTINGANSTVRTLGKDDTGTVTANGSLTIGGAVAVTITGNNATLNNQGGIRQTGSGRAIRDNTGATGLLIINGSAANGAALMQTADADVIQMNKANASVTLNNYGSMISLNASAGGAQAVDFSSITSGANVVNLSLIHI